MRQEDSRRHAVMEYIRSNINILNDNNSCDLDKEISRLLLKEEINFLLKEFLHIKKSGTYSDQLGFKKDIHEIKDLLFSYLISHQDDKQVKHIYENTFYII